jgi:hypothetical protein
VLCFQLTLFSFLFDNKTDHWFSVLLGCSSGRPGLGSVGILVLRLAGGHRPHCRNRHAGTPPLQPLLVDLWPLQKSLVQCVNSASSLLQAYAGSQVLQSIILLCTGTNKGGGYLAPRWLFLVMYLSLTFIWAVLNTFALEVIAVLDVISMWWQVTNSPLQLICFQNSFRSLKNAVHQGTQAGMTNFLDVVCR